MNNIDEYIKVKYGYDKDYKLNTEVNANDVVIGHNNSNGTTDKGFLIGIVNVDVLLNLNMFVIMLMYISSQYYIMQINK